MSNKSKRYKEDLKNTIHGSIGYSTSQQCEDNYRKSALIFDIIDLEPIFMF